MAKVYELLEQTIFSIADYYQVWVLMSKLLGMDLPKWLTDYCTNFWPLSVIKNGKKCTQKTKLHLLFGSKHSVKESEILLTQLFSTICLEISLLLMPQIQNRPLIGKMWHLALRFPNFHIKCYALHTYIF